MATHVKRAGCDRRYTGRLRRRQGAQVNLRGSTFGRNPDAPFATAARRAYGLTND